MSRIMLGVVCGLVYGALSAASMLPLSFSDKPAALTGAFINRFAIGFLIGASQLPWPGWLAGLVIGLLLSVPESLRADHRLGSRWRDVDWMDRSAIWAVRTST